jgi:hypothetical protein
VTEPVFTPDDRVLVAVIPRRRDLRYLLRDLWYRIPVTAAPGCIDMDIIAFFVDGGVRYYAPLAGYELFRRRDLLPLESTHPRQNMLYFKLQFREILIKDPPILNPERRRFSFIFTDWEHFRTARIISELYRRKNNTESH